MNCRAMKPVNRIMNTLLIRVVRGESTIQLRIPLIVITQIGSS
jgi:hypothetical protein